jgi:hypothetical protein
MNKPKFAAMGLCSLLALCSLVGCWDSDPCDPGQVFRGGSCFPDTAGSSGSGGSAAGGEAGATADATAGTSAVGTESTWRKACTTNDDCGGDSPICATAPLNYCTNINCSAGEANAGICPMGWTCFPASSGNPSACVNF